MPQLDPKYVRDSCAEQIQILMPEHINGYNRLFGGKLMEWIDVVSGVVARRHSGRNVTTAAIDNLQFKGPAYVNSTVVLRGQVTYVGKTSMVMAVSRPYFLCKPLSIHFLLFRGKDFVNAHQKTFCQCLTKFIHIAMMVKRREACAMTGC